MLIPKEQPHIAHLNSYFLELERLVSYMQDEVCSGCIYGRAIGREAMVYFSEVEVIACLVQDNGNPYAAETTVDDIAHHFARNNFVVSVHYLDLNAVYHWATMRPFVRKDDVMISRSSFLKDLIDGYREEMFTGFFDFDAGGRGGLVFFEGGRLIGGSYAWGRGGLRPWASDLDRLVSLADSGRHRLRIGRFNDPLPLETARPGGGAFTHRATR